MTEPILKQDHRPSTQSLYLAQGRDASRQFFCRIASLTRPDMNRSYWMQRDGQLERLILDFVNLDKQLPPAMAKFRSATDAGELSYRELRLFEGDTISVAVAVEQDDSGVIWEMIFTLPPGGSSSQ